MKIVEELKTVKKSECSQTSEKSQISEDSKKKWKLFKKWLEAIAHDVLPVAMFPLLYTDIYLFWHSANLIYSSAKRSCDITCIEIELCIWTWLLGAPQIQTTWGHCWNCFANGFWQILWICGFYCFYVTSIKDWIGIVWIPGNW